MSKYYAVIKGYNPGVYDSWEGSNGALQQVANFPGKLFMSFSSFEKAQLWYKDKIKQSGLSNFHSKQTRDILKYKQRLETYQKGGKTIIYVSSSQTQKIGKGGWGVFVDDQTKPMSYSGSIRRIKAYKFDLVAMKKALQLASGHKNVVIAMNFNIVAKAFDKGWPFNWRINNWKNSKGQPPQEVELWKQILHLFESVEPELMVMPPYADITGHKKTNSLALRERSFLSLNQPKRRNPKWKPRRKKNKMKKSRNVYSSNPQR